MSIARHLVPPSGEDFRVVQGTIRQWDPETFANAVEYDGITVPNVPVASGVEALTYQAGDVVLIEEWFPGGKRGELGLGSLWIRGRVVTPGSGAADQTIAFLRTALAEQISAQIFAARIHSAEDLSSVTTGSTSFTDLGGPEIANVEITSAGRALVMVTAAITAGTFGGGDTTQNGHMAYEVSGATSRVPVVWVATQAGVSVPTLGDESRVHQRASALSLVEGLNQGPHTFAARYRKSNASAENPTFLNRNITVIGF